ncbi:MAG: hypothetical protein C4536_06165 [Actinobacteria bacterium]|jgi:hypothetical protein|nr:MAG: hypothetical protein C4536_06165 [Actinomycetota bacterium]
MQAWKGLLARRRTEYALVLVFFLLITIIFTWPLLLHLHDGLTNNSSDTLCNTWIISWNSKTMFTQPARLFQANSFYPSRDTLAYSEILLPISLLASPIYYTTRNPILAYNILLVLGMVLSAFGCYLLVKELTGSRWGALAAGIFYAFCPYKMSLIGELHLLFAPFLPLMFLYFYRYQQTGQRKDLVLFGLFFLLQSLSSWHYLVFCAFAVALLLVWTAVFSRHKRDWLRLAGVLAAVLIAAALILPFALPYVRVHSRLPDFERSREDAEIFSAVPGDYLRVVPESLVYGSTPPPFREYVPGATAVLYPGLLVLILALAGLFVRRRENDDLLAFDRNSYRKGFLFFLLFTVVGIILTFGPSIGSVDNPVYMIPYNLGILKIIRFPTRFFLMVSLGLAVMAGYGIARIATRISQWRRNLGAGRLAAAALIFLLLLELATFNLVIYPIPVWGQVPDVYSWLEEQGDVEVVELPATILGPGSVRYDDWHIGFMPAQADYTTREALLQYYSIYHWKRIANGYSGYLPFFYRRIYTEMQAFPSQRSVDLLLALDIDYVIWHWDWVDADMEAAFRDRLSSTSGISLEGDFGNESVFRIEKRATATPEDLEVSMASPHEIPSGEGFNLAFMLRNAGDGPIAMAVEDPQSFRLRFLDTRGNEACEEKGEYRVPFFLEPGEETYVPLQAAAAPGRGSYTMELSLSGGLLGEWELSKDIEVMEPGDLIASAVLNGMVRAGGDHAEAGPIEADGTLPLSLEVDNTGTILWRSSWEKEQVGTGYPYGLVYVGALWMQGEEVVWEEQAAVLPCDVSPGQSIEAPILLRSPPVPGPYRLVLGLRDKELDWFGEIFVMEFEVKEAAGTPP